MFHHNFGRIEDSTFISTEYSKKTLHTAMKIILARDWAYVLSALYAIARPSVCPSHGWISQKSLKLGCNFHRMVVPSLWFLRDKFHPET